MDEHGLRVPVAASLLTALRLVTKTVAIVLFILALHQGWRLQRGSLSSALERLKLNLFVIGADVLEVHISNSLVLNLFFCRKEIVIVLLGVQLDVHLLDLADVSITTNGLDTPHQHTSISNISFFQLSTLPCVRGIWNVISVV